MNFTNNNQQNNRRNSINVTDRLFISYSDNSMFVIQAWNEQLSIRLSPATGVNENGLTNYETDMNKTILTGLTVDGATALLEGIKKYVLPAYEKGEAKSVSIVVNNNKRSFVTNPESIVKKIITVGTDGTNTYFSIGVGADDNNKVDPSNVVKHVFNTREYYLDFDHTKGSGDKVLAQSEFITMIKKIEDIYKLGPAASHASEYRKRSRESFIQNKQQRNAQGFNQGFNMNQQQGSVIPMTNANDFSAFMEMA